METFEFVTEQFADIRILRYQVPGFEKLEKNDRKFLFCLQEAALWGKEIVFDQYFEYNLLIKRSFEEIYTTYQGNRSANEFASFELYLKRLWFSNGIHHHYSNDKFIAEFSRGFLEDALQALSDDFWEGLGIKKENAIQLIVTSIFEKDFAAEKVVLDAEKDWLKESAVNFYKNISKDEAIDFYIREKAKNINKNISFGLNSQLVKEDGKIRERIYKKEGLYQFAIEKIIYWLKESLHYCSSKQQHKVIEKLILFYETGDLETFDAYSIAWVQNTEVDIDFTNGFIEVYDDPMGMKGTYQSLIYIKDTEMTEKLEAISKNAMWFEKNSPISENHKRTEVKGISYKVIHAVVESGDCAPSSPLGVNLPNADWIRSLYGSKSISLGNIEQAYEEASKKDGVLDEFFSKDQANLQRECGLISNKLHTALHEVIGHGSGRIEDGVSSSGETLKNYSSILEEARADLVALYFLFDEKMIELQLTNCTEVGKCAYDAYLVNGMIKQLVRIKLGDNIEQTHMRARALICNWVYEKGKMKNLIEMYKAENKTFLRINDFEELRRLFGLLLKEIQRIKSQGDYNSGKDLVEKYGIKVNKALHEEVLERYNKLGIAPSSGFIQPQLIPVSEKGKLISYPEDFTEQMLFYSSNYKVLPTIN